MLAALARCPTCTGGTWIACAVSSTPAWSALELRSKSRLTWLGVLSFPSFGSCRYASASIGLNKVSARANSTGSTMRPDAAFSSIWLGQLAPIIAAATFALAQHPRQRKLSEGKGQPRPPPPGKACTASSTGRSSQCGRICVPIPGSAAREMPAGVGKPRPKGDFRHAQAAAAKLAVLHQKIQETGQDLNRHRSKCKPALALTILRPAWRR